MTDLASKVRATVLRLGMLSPGDGVVVAVSGGADSVALLHLLLELRDEFDLCLEVAHLQHGLRGEEGREDALFVQSLAESLGLPFHLKEVDLPVLKAEKRRGNLEALGREARYRFFAALAGERGLGKVATAHTRDDQVETLLMWLLRGSGRKGLGGMPPVQKLRWAEVSVIRPLIEVSRWEVLSYLAARDLEYRTDRTNLDTGLLRNWIRLKLLPGLREAIDPHIDERLAQLGDLMREEETFLDGVARERLGLVVRREELERQPLLRETKAMQRRIIRLWLAEKLGDVRGLAFRHVEEALRFVNEGPPQGSVSLPGGWSLVREYETLRLARAERKQRRPAEYSYPLPSVGTIVIREAGMKIHVSRDYPSLENYPRSEAEALFDLSSLPEPLTLRNFRPGDRFQPLGMKGHKKVKELFVEKKVPASVRATLPLLVAGDEILWIPGYGRSDLGKVGPGTSAVLKVTAERLDTDALK